MTFKPGTGLPPRSVRFEVDASQVLQFEEALEKEIPAVMQRIEERSSLLARQALVNTFADAMDRLTYDQFAPEFRDKILENVGKMPITTHVTRQSGEVEFDLGFLGDKSDLEKAFHRHAVLKGGHRLLEPYTGQELAVEDADARHEYFLAMMQGLTSFTSPLTGVESPIPAGAWERTKQEYLAIWGNKSPQWLYLEYGQSRYTPRIPATPLIENVQEAVDSIVDFVFNQEFDAAFKIAQQAIRTPTSTGGIVLQAPKGGITIRGHEYKGGQFVGPRASF